MLNGNDFWPVSLTSQMVRCNYKGRKVYTYTYAPKNIYADLYESASKHGDKAAIISDDGSVTTYNEFLEYVKSFSQHLYYDCGIRKGDFVALLLYNTLEFCVSFYALAKIGAVTVPMNTKHKPGEWSSQLSQLPVKMILIQQKLLNAIHETGALNNDIAFVISGDQSGYRKYFENKEYSGDPYCESAWEDDLLVMFTSGTTSTSKSVVLSNFNVVNSIMSYEKILDITDKDSTIIATPIYHITGLIALLSVFIHCGASIYLHTTFNAENVLSCVVKNNVTLIHASPTVFIMLLEKKDMFPKVSSLRLFACGSANMPTEVISKLHKWLPNMEFRTVYGLTESSAAGSMFPSDAAVSASIGSSGLPVPGVLMKLIDDNEDEVAEGEAGELCMFGNVVLDRYYNMNSDALSQDGWFKTGDIARFDKHGYIYIIDRKKDMINRGGEKIWSNEVEETIHKLKGVLEVAVIGVPDSKYGEVAMAVIRKTEGSLLNAATVQQWVGKYMAKYATPKYVEFVSQLPMTPNGKISKRTLREKYCKIGINN